MSTSLFQSSTASFPDRPVNDGVGLAVVMSVGDEGAYLAHDLGSGQAVLHCRFVMSPWGLSGGRVVVLGGRDAVGAEALRVSFDAGTHTLSVWLPGGVSLSTALNEGIAWSCVEVSLDTVSGQAKLWVNGVLAGQASGDLSASVVQTVLFGAVYKQAGLVGDLFLDEICISDSYIGPVLVVPTSSYADDPARWLVVYNAADIDGHIWAESYRQARGIPFANMLGLMLPTTEVVSGAQYSDLITAVDEYLAVNQLDGQVMGVLLGFGVPGYVDFTGSGPLEAVPALMQTGSSVAGTVTNVNSSGMVGARLTADDLSGERMTARIDAVDQAGADALVERASLMSQSVLDADVSSIYFDPFVGTSPAYQSAFNAMIDWATGLRGMRERLPIVFSGDPSGNAEAAFDSVSGDGVFWGWSSTYPDPGIFDESDGQRAVCGQLYLGGGTATSLRNTVPDNWADMPIAAGYASTVVSSRDNLTSWLPDTGVFFDALVEGWTLAEAWHIAQPVLRSGFYLVGDPLMRVNTPRDGVEVYGPMTEVEALGPSVPSYILPKGTARVELGESIPVLGESGTYMVRRSDSLGRLEASVQSIRVMNDGGEPSLPAVMPIWPDVDGWAVWGENAGLRFMVDWGQSLSSARVGAVELLGEPDGGAEALVLEPVINRRDDRIQVDLAYPLVKTRYRWRLVSDNGVVAHTPWSSWVDPVTVPVLGLQQIGGGS